MSDNDLEEFGEQLAQIRADEELGWAVVVDARLRTREAALDDVIPSHPTASDSGVEIAFETATGRRWTQWFEKPKEWDSFSSDLVLLLEYWGLPPTGLVDLSSETEADDCEVPIKSGDPPSIDWGEIYEVCEQRRLEAGDDE